jgi:hypothetical protein
MFQSLVQCLSKFITLFAKQSKRSSAWRAPTSYKPTGRPRSSLATGKVIAGVCSVVHAMLNTAPPVAAKPSGALPAAVGMIRKSSSVMASSNCSRENRTN